MPRRYRRRGRVPDRGELQEQIMRVVQRPGRAAVDAVRARSDPASRDDELA